MDVALILTAIAAVGSVMGAIFATWRWEYARRAYDLQKKQIYLQISMLAESRDYWRTPKMTYVKRNRPSIKYTDKEIEKVLSELENVK